MIRTSEKEKGPPYGDPFPHVYPNGDQRSAPAPFA